jgi:hypothetical protein
MNVAYEDKKEPLTVDQVLEGKDEDLEQVFDDNHPE